jgi:8-hydroxy-5-deazaflavin:NADPH oxidoreductase
MKIGIIGSGDVARALAQGLDRKGHAVCLGTSQPGKLGDWSPAHPGVRVTGMAEAAHAGELIVLAVKGSAAVSVVTALAADLAGKTVIDTSNPIADEAPVNGVLRYFTGPNESLLERLQGAAPQARFVKAFNSVGAAHMVDPVFDGGPPTMFIAGNDTAAKATVCSLLAEVGWAPADMGQAEAARAIEPLCMLWCLPGFLRNDWAHAFRLLTPAAA